jgi:hypothetical protein
MLKGIPQVALVGHGMAADLKILDTMGVIIPAGEHHPSALPCILALRPPSRVSTFLFAFQRPLSDDYSHPGTEIIDTNCLASALSGGKPVQYSLRALLGQLQIPDVHKLHNGGNDARYTLLAMLRMSGYIHE